MKIIYSVIFLIFIRIFFDIPTIIYKRFWVIIDSFLTIQNIHFFCNFQKFSRFSTLFKHQLEKKKKKNSILHQQQGKTQFRIKFNSAKKYIDIFPNRNHLFSTYITTTIVPITRDTQFVILLLWYIVYTSPSRVCVWFLRFHCSK